MASLSKALRRCVSAPAWVGLVGYGLTILIHYSAVLDRHLVYKQPAVDAAVEDVIGYGFWPTWAVMACVMLALLALSHALGARQWRSKVTILAIFIILSAGDYFLYAELTSQLLR